MHQAKLRSVLTQIDQYRSAVNAFKLQYNALPGDLTNAYDYWGAQVGCTNVNTNTDWHGCNGDGNRVVNSDTNETLRFWQQLALAGVIPGTYSGGRNTIVKIGTDVPAAPFPNVGFSWLYSAEIVVAANTWAHTYRLQYPAFTNSEARDMDVKIDDGIYGKGKFYGTFGKDAAGNWSYTTMGDCRGIGPAGLGNYNINDPNVACILYVVYPW